MANKKACMGHATDEWRTPKDIFDQLNLVYCFTLDAAATEENALCDEYIDRSMDSLAVSWGNESSPSRVFLNPPFSLLREFCDKARQEVEHGRAAVVVAILPARTDTRAFHESINGKATVEFVKGRIKFVGGKAGAPFPSMIAVWKKPINVKGS